MKWNRFTHGVRLALQTCLLVTLLLGLSAGGAVQRVQASRPLAASDQPFLATSDPSLIWNTFLGGTKHDVAIDIARDGTGYIYVAGNSYAPWGCMASYCTVRPYTDRGDSFVAKLDGAGRLVWNTFLGSADMIDGSLGIAVGLGGNASIFGLSNYGDAWVSRLDASGNLIWSTSLGPVSSYSGAIAMDRAGNAYVAGYYEGMETYAFVTKLDSFGNALWRTLLPHAAAGSGCDIFVDVSGNIYITGSSNSTWGAPRRPFQGDVDAFVVKLDPSGRRIWNTFLGGPGVDVGYGIARDAKGNVFVTGRTDFYSWGNPILPFIDADAFVARLDPYGKLVWNTFLGSRGGGDQGAGIAVDASGSAYVGGLSYANWGSPVRSPLVCPDYRIDTWDVFVAKLSAAGNLTYHTFLGSCEGDGGGQIAVDERGHVFVAGISMFTWGKPRRAFQGGLFDGFAAKVSTPWTTVFRSTGSQDGWVLESSETSGLGGFSNATATTLRLGDSPAKRQYRSILSFPTGTLPDTARILSATLTLRSQSVTPDGTDPFRIFRGLQIEVQKGCFNANCALQTGDFQAAASAPVLGPLYPSPVGGVYTIPLPPALFPYINKLDFGGGRTQLRLRFNLDDNNDLIANYLSFYSGNITAASYRPSLAILYYGP